MNNLKPIKELESVSIYKDFGQFGDGKWAKHLTLVSWFGKEPKYDIRPWNADMTKYGKGVTLESSELYDLMSLIEDILGMSDEDDADEEGEEADTED